MTTWETVYRLLPEILLVAGGMLTYLLGAFYRARETWGWFGVGVVLVAGIALEAQVVFPPYAEPGLVALDALAHFGRTLALAAGLLLLLFALRSVPSTQAAEQVGTLLILTAGAMLTAAAADLVLLFVALELVSIPTYVLLYLGRRGASYQEATAKYFFLSILSSALLLYGFSFLYGAAGTTDLAAMRLALAGPEAADGFAVFSRIGLVLALAGLGFRVTAVPFHFYAPDVYQGTTFANAALLSIVPKLAGFVVLIRLLIVALPGLESPVWRLALALSVLTMTFGNVVALWQDNLRRLLAYSSIAQAGYMLIGLSVAAASAGGQDHWDGVAALLFYLTVYAVATAGIFGALAYLGSRERQLESVEELAGLGRTRPLVAAMLAACLFSLAGIPPLAGFWGKFTIFGSALAIEPGVAGADARQIQWWFIALAVVGVLNAAIAAAYYLRVIAAMYFRTPLATPRGEGGAGPWTVAVVCTLLTLGLGVYPDPLLQMADGAAPVQAVERVEAAAAAHGDVVPAASRLASSGEDLPPLRAPLP